MLELTTLWHPQLNVFVFLSSNHRYITILQYNFCLFLYIPTQFHKNVMKKVINQNQNVYECHQSIFTQQCCLGSSRSSSFKARTLLIYSFVAYIFYIAKALSMWDKGEVYPKLQKFILLKHPGAIFCVYCFESTCGFIKSSTLLIYTTEHSSSP